MGIELIDNKNDKKKKKEHHKVYKKYTDIKIL